VQRKGGRLTEKRATLVEREFGDTMEAPDIHRMYRGINVPKPRGMRVGCESQKRDGDLHGRKNTGTCVKTYVGTYNAGKRGDKNECRQGS